MPLQMRLVRLGHEKVKILSFLVENESFPFLHGVFTCDQKHNNKPRGVSMCLKRWWANKFFLL